MSRPIPSFLVESIRVAPGRVAMFPRQRLLFALVAALTISACKSVPPARPTTLEPHKGVIEAPRGRYLSKDMALYSVEVRTWGWRFLLMPVEFEPSHAYNYNNLYRASELPAAFRSLPKGARVFWQENPDKVWTYPPEALSAWVERTAKRAGVEFRYNPWIASIRPPMDSRFTGAEANENPEAIKSDADFAIFRSCGN